MVVGTIRIPSVRFKSGPTKHWGSKRPKALVRRQNRARNKQARATRKAQRRIGK